MAHNNTILDTEVLTAESGYLTLKEASELSQYSPDYIGQLIRAGKIDGKQIYSNIAWVTTEESLRAYMQKKGKDSSFVSDTPDIAVIPEFFRPLLYTIIVCSILFILILLHIFSVTIDRAMSASYQDKEAISAKNI